MARNLRCSFCGKSEHEVQKLVAGPSVTICDACIGIASRIIADDGAPPAPGLWSRVRRGLQVVASRLRGGAALRAGAAAASPGS